MTKWGCSAKPVVSGGCEDLDTETAIWARDGDTRKNVGSRKGVPR